MSYYIGTRLKADGIEVYGVRHLGKGGKRVVPIGEISQITELEDFLTEKFANDPVLVRKLGIDPSSLGK